ncbi:Golgi membrane exchange factor (Ric1p-Rgp1p) subunit, partial [Dipsacomyces acuminosporus]
MGLTITATLEEHGIYFAGDTLECHVRFANERSTQKLVARNPPSSAFVRGPREVPGHHSHLSRALGSGLSDGPRSAVVRPSGQSLLYSNGPPSAGYPAGNGNFFPNLDDNSEYSASSTPGGYAAPQYGGVVSNDAAAGGIKLQAVPANPRKSGAARADSVRAASRASERSGTGMQPYKRSGLSAFPSLGEHAGSPAETSPRLEASSAVQGGSGHKTSVVGGKGTAGGGIGPGGNAASQSERPSSYQSKSSLIPQRNTSSPRLPGASRPTQASSGRGADTDKVRIEPVGNDVKAHESSGVFPRLSSSSALSSPSTGFASWFSFGGKQKQQEADVQRQLKTPHTSLSHDGTASETGTGGLLGSLWRNISGGSPSRPATRAGTISGDACMEKLAIGFAEASGSLSLASSYIKPEQLELLLMHNGTDYSSKGSAKAIAIGGGMGSWVPPGSVQSPGSAGGRGQKCLPLLISSPTVLFSDLVLSPGESQTFSLKIQLPRSLPPSFNGRAARVSYDLVIVAKRNMFESNAYVVRIPFRVKAFVGQSGSPESFTLERPIRMLPNQSKLTHQELLLDSTPRNASPFLHAGKREGSVSAVAAGISGIELADRLAASTSVDLGDAGGTADGLCKQLSESSFLQSMLKHVDSDTENTN